MPAHNSITKNKVCYSYLSVQAETYANSGNPFKSTYGYYFGKEHVVQINMTDPHPGTEKGWMQLTVNIEGYNYQQSFDKYFPTERGLMLACAAYIRKVKEFITNISDK